MLNRLPIEPLISSQRINTQVEELSKKIAELTMNRYSQWLISQKYIVNGNDFDDVLSGLGIGSDSVIFGEEERKSESQRILLEIEKAKAMERQLKAEEARRIRLKVTSRIASITEELLIDRMLKLPVDKLLFGFPDIGFFTSFAYSQSLSFSKLGEMTTHSKSLSSNIVELVGDDHFCKLMNKTVRPTNDPKAAIGFIGIENCRRLFPLLLAKPLLRWKDKNTSFITPKIWKSSVLTANITRMRLEDAGYKEPDEGILLGVVRNLPYYAIANHFSQVFNDALVNVMAYYREKKLMDEYHACSEVKPPLKILCNAIMKAEKLLAKRIVEHIEWSSKVRHLRSALIEDIQDIAIPERSLHGGALGQARAFSIHRMMEKSGVFVEKHMPFWFAHVRMDQNTISDIQMSNPSKIPFVS